MTVRVRMLTQIYIHVQKFMDKVDELSEQALRVLAIACNHLGENFCIRICKHIC